MGDRQSEFLPLGINTQEWKSGRFFDTDLHRKKNHNFSFDPMRAGLESIFFILPCPEVPSAQAPRWGMQAIGEQQRPNPRLLTLSLDQC